VNKLLKDRETSLARLNRDIEQARAAQREEVSNARAAQQTRRLLNAEISSLSDALDIARRAAGKADRDREDALTLPR